MKPYIIVRGMNLDDLEEKVEEFIVEGYIPTGGLASIGRHVTQAVYHLGVSKVMGRLDLTPPPAPSNHGSGVRHRSKTLDGKTV